MPPYFDLMLVGFFLIVGALGGLLVVAVAGGLALAVVGIFVSYTWHHRRERDEYKDALGRMAREVIHVDDFARRYERDFLDADNRAREAGYQVLHKLRQLRYNYAENHNTLFVDPLPGNGLKPKDENDNEKVR